MPDSTFPFEIELYDDAFLVDREGGKYFLEHVGSSLLGSGKTIVEAHINLIENARVAADSYASFSSDELHASALRLRDILLRII